MSNRWVVLLIVVLIAAFVLLALWMRHPDPVTPAANHTENVAPQAMLWNRGVEKVMQTG